MKLLNRYIRRTVITSTLLVVAILIGVESFMEFVGQLGQIGQAHYGIWQALLFVPMQLPADLYQLFPMAGFLGGLLGLGRLASSSELVVMRASGVSIARIGWSVIKAALLMIVFVTLIGEWVAPYLQNKSALMKSIATGHYQRLDLSHGVWFRKKQAFIHIGSMTSPTEMRNITRFTFNDHYQMLSALRAPQGTLQASGVWLLHHVAQTQFTSQGVKVAQLASLPLPIVIKPKLLQSAEDATGRESIADLWKNIRYRHQTGLVATQYEFAFWQRIIQPLTSVIMICLGVPFIFGSLRSSSTGARVLTGVIVGFGFYMLNQFFGPITLVYQFPPILAAILPTLLFALIYLIMMRRVR